MSLNLQSRPYTAWQLIHAYWKSEQRTFAYAMFVVVILMSLAIVGMDVVFNYWSNYFYNALQDYDKRGAIDLLVVFTFLAVVHIVLAVYRYYVQQYLGLRWRKWLTGEFLTRWLEKKSYYYLENFDEKTDNPDQRIQEDIASLVSNSLDLSIGFFVSVTTFIAFIFILWNLSGTFTLHLPALGNVHVHGYLVWVAMIYALVGTWLTFKIGRPLVPLNFEQQRREADFRFAAVDLRTHAENVALYRGEAHQKSILTTLFGRVLDNWYAIILRQKMLLWFTAGYNQVSVLVPLVVTLPNYFGKVFKLGGFMQSLRAFAQIQDALSFFVNSYTQIAQWRAVVQRLLTFINHVHEVEQYAATQNKFIFKKDSTSKIIVRNLCISTPRGEKLLENINEEFVHGHNYMIKGASGLGKSTFIRAIAGIWPYGSGEICLPADNKVMMYLPQKSYMPIGTLKEALLFPNQASDIDDAVLVQVLKDCDLPDLISRLHDVAMWSEQLSPGELQRVSFARVLLRKPYWVFLDESTSALDLPHEQQLYALLKEQVPNCSFVTVGHQPSVEVFHEHKVDLTKYHVDRMVVA